MKNKTIRPVEQQGLN